MNEPTRGVRIAEHRTLNTGRAIAAVSIVLVAAGVIAACATFGRHHLDFTALGRAKRIEVRRTGASDGSVTTISDRDKVQFAIDFVLKRQDRWGDRLNPYVPTLVLRFYADGEYLGGYGIGPDMLMALPDHGFWWRDVPVSEMNTLLKALGVQLRESR